MEAVEEGDISCNGMDDEGPDEGCGKRLITVIYRKKIETSLKPTDKAVLLMLKDDLITVGKYHTVFAN